MKQSDLVEFMCIGAGRHDCPPYSNDGKWRVGMLIKYNAQQNSTILYMSELFTIPTSQVREIKEQK